MILFNYLNEAAQGAADFSVRASVESHSSVIISRCLDQEDGGNREMMFSDAVLIPRSVSSLSLFPSCMFPPSEPL